MYIAFSQHGIKPDIEVDYRKDFNTYVLRLSNYTHIGMSQEEIENLYHQVLNAMMYKSYLETEEVIEPSWEN